MRTFVSETDCYEPVIETARMLGWLVAHFRPAQTKHGWRTAVSGDGAGFPDFVLVHAGAHQVWFVEFKVDGAKPSLEQLRWGESLILADAKYRLVYVPSGLQHFLQDLADAVRPM